MPTPPAPSPPSAERRTSAPGGSPGAWFAPGEQSAVQDFWQIYDRWFEEIEPRSDSTLGGVRTVLREAVRSGDWTAYEDLLTRRSERSAALGQTPDAQEDPGGDLARALTPHLVHAYLDAPDRLIAALDVMSRFLARRTSALATAYDRAGEASFRAREQSLAITLESIGDGVIATDARGLVERMNPVAQELSRWTLDDAKGRPLEEIFRVFDEDIGEVIPCRTDEVLERGVVLGLPRHSAIIAKDGSRRPIADSMAPIRDDEGVIHGVVVVFRDLTRERENELALEASRLRIASILEASLDAVLGVDAVGVVNDSNAAAERMFGRTRLIGKRFQDLLVHPAGRRAYVDVLARDLGKRREMHAVRADGTEFPVDIAIVRIPAEGVVSFTCFIRDLTEAKAAEQALTESHEQLRSLAGKIESCREEERTRIARELHDELGQQLTAIRMDIGWLAPRQRGAPEVAERLEAMSELVDSTFAMVRRLGTELRPNILDDLGLAEALEWQANEFEVRSGIRVNIDTSGEAGSLDPVLTTAVFRIFQEILTNVGRHSGATRVVGHLSVEASAVTLEVTDDGRGIRPEEVVNPKSLGLLGMRERAALYGGTFEIGALGHQDGAEGGGTVVSVTLPRGEAAP